MQIQIIEMSMLNVMINLINTARTINILYICFIHICSDLSQYITVNQFSLNSLMKTSMKKNIMMNILMNTIMIKKKIFIRQILRRTHFMIQSVTMMMSHQLQTHLKRSIILISFTSESASLTIMYAACVKQCFHQTISYISTYDQLTE